MVFTYGRVVITYSQHDDGCNKSRTSLRSLIRIRAIRVDKVLNKNRARGFFFCIKGAGKKREWGKGGGRGLEGVGEWVGCLSMIQGQVLVG